MISTFTLFTNEQDEIEIHKVSTIHPHEKLRAQNRDI